MPICLAPIASSKRSAWPVSHFFRDGHVFFKIYSRQASCVDAESDVA